MGKARSAFFRLSKISKTTTFSKKQQAQALYKPCAVCALLLLAREWTYKTSTVSRAFTKHVSGSKWQYSGKTKLWKSQRPTWDHKHRGHCWYKNRLRCHCHDLLLPSKEMNLVEGKKVVDQNQCRGAEKKMN